MGSHDGANRSRNRPGIGPIKGLIYAIARIFAVFLQKTVKRNKQIIEQVDKNPRKLSKREAARLQGFPDTFKPNNSNVQAYKQFGNSVTVNVINEIAKKITQYID